MTTRSRTFFPSLESLRGIAALIVVFYHIGWMNPVYDVGVIRNGALMVDLFFVLSGFVMMHCYGHVFSGGKSLWIFLRARFWRLYPLHFFMLLIFLGIEVVKYIAESKFGIVSGNPAFSKSNGESFFYHIFLVHSIVQQHGSFNSPSWSISVEFYTYIVFALIMVMAKTPRYLSIIFMILVWLSLFIIIEQGHTSLTFDYQDSIFRCLYGFFIGAFIHCVYQKVSINGPLKNTSHLGLVAFIIVFSLLAYFLGIKHDNYIEFLVPPLVAFLILLLTLFPEHFFSSVFCWKPFLWLGKVSYSIYMVHMAFIWFFSAFLQSVLGIPKKALENGNEVISTTMLEGTLATIALVICILYTSHFTFKYIEEPCRKWAKKNSIK